MCNYWSFFQGNPRVFFKICVICVPLTSFRIDSYLQKKNQCFVLQAQQTNKQKLNNSTPQQFNTSTILQLNKLTTHPFFFIFLIIPNEIGNKQNHSVGTNLKFGSVTKESVMMTNITVTSIRIKPVLRSSCFFNRSVTS